MRHAVDDFFLIGRERKFWGGDVGKAGSAVEATGEGQGGRRLRGPARRRCRRAA